MFLFFLGGSSRDGSEIKKHRFFDGINWKKLEKKQIPAPFKPRITNPLDTSNFSTDFTKLPPIDHDDATAPRNHEKLFRGMS